jgi:hypothetical protein
MWRSGIDDAFDLEAARLILEAPRTRSWRSLGEMIEHSYDLVVAALSKKAGTELGL